jgi:hypothetical protein
VQPAPAVQPAAPSAPPPHAFSPPPPLSAAAPPAAVGTPQPLSPSSVVRTILAARSSGRTGTLLGGVRSSGSSPPLGAPAPAGSPVPAPTRASSAPPDVERAGPSSTRAHSHEDSGEATIPFVRIDRGDVADDDVRTRVKPLQTLDDLDEDTSVFASVAVGRPGLVAARNALLDGAPAGEVVPPTRASLHDGWAPPSAPSLPPKEEVVAPPSPEPAPAPVEAAPVSVTARPPAQAAAPAVARPAAARALSRVTGTLVAVLDLAVLDDSDPNAVPELRVRLLAPGEEAPRGAVRAVLCCVEPDDEARFEALLARAT